MARVNFGSIDDHIAFQVHLTWRAIKKKLLVSSKRFEGRVSRGSYSIPILIGMNPGITPQELAKALHLDASKIALFLRDLEESGMVARTPSDTDKRKVQLNLTEEGEALAAQVMLASKVIEEPISSLITKEEVSELIRILTKIQTSI